MKRILLVSLVMLLTVSVAFSQFGIKGGINLATFRGDDKAINPGMFDPSLSGLPNLEPKTRVGIVGGISYRINLLAGLSIQPEVLYVQKGAKYELSQTIGGYTGTGTVTMKGDYLDIPLLLKFNLPIPQFSPYIEGGVSYGILLGAKAKMEMSSNAPGAQSTSDEEDIKDQLKPGELSVLVGVGFDITVLELNARFVMGMNRLMKDQDSTPTYDENSVKIYNSGIIITAGIRLP